MNETGVFALIAIIGAALLIHALDKYLERRRKVKRLMKIIGALDSAYRTRKATESKEAGTGAAGIGGTGSAVHGLAQSGIVRGLQVSISRRRSGHDGSSAGAR